MQRSLVNRLAISLAVIVLIFSMQACSNDDPASPGSDPTPPELPDVSTMQLDLSFFNSAGVDRASATKGHPTPALLAANTGKDHFINAAVRVLYIHLAFCAAFEPPVAAFALAIHSVPQHQPDGSWLWTYIFVDQGIDYGIFLYGKNEGPYVSWRMEVSTNNPEMPLDHFVWFEGKDFKDGTGYWHFFEPADGPSGEGQTPGVSSLSIDWMNAPGGIHQLRLTVLKEGAPDEGNTLVFYESPVIHYILLTDYATNPEGDEYHITWYPDGSGHMLVPDYPANDPGTKVCWDTRQYDTVCSD